VVICACTAGLIVYNWYFSCGVGSRQGGCLLQDLTVSGTLNTAEIVF